MMQFARENREHTRLLSDKNAREQVEPFLTSTTFVNIFNIMYEPSGISALPALITLFDQGHFEILTQALSLATSVSLPVSYGMYFSVQCGEDVGQANDALGGLQAFAVDDRAELPGDFVPATVGMPRRGVLDDDDWCVGIRTTLPRERFADCLAAQCFKRQPVGTNQCGPAKVIQQLLIAEDLQRTLLHGHDWPVASAFGEETLELEQCLQGHVRPRCGQEAQFGCPWNAAQVGFVQRSRWARQANPLWEHGKA